MAYGATLGRLVAHGWLERPPPSCSRRPDTWTHARAGSLDCSRGTWTPKVTTCIFFPAHPGSPLGPDPGCLGLDVSQKLLWVTSLRTAGNRTEHHLFCFFFPLSTGPTGRVWATWSLCSEVSRSSAKQRSCSHFAHRQGLRECPGAAVTRYHERRFGRASQRL